MNSHIEYGYSLPGVQDYLFEFHQSVQEGGPFMSLYLCVPILEHVDDQLKDYYTIYSTSILPRGVFTNTVVDNNIRYEVIASSQTSTRLISTTDTVGTDVIEFFTNLVHHYGTWPELDSLLRAYVPELLL